MHIPLAPTTGQRRIVESVLGLFGEIEAGEQELEKAREGRETYRRAVLKAAVTGELTKEWRANNAPNEERPAAFTTRHDATKEVHAADLARLPDGWTWATVGQLSSVTGGLTKNARNEPIDMRLPYLRVANVQENAFDLSDIREIGVRKSQVRRVALESGDLLFVEGNGSPDQIGRVALWDGRITECVHQNHLIKARPAHKSISEWLLIWFLSPHGKRLVRRVASSTSGLHTLSISKIEALACPLPPAREMAAAIDATRRYLDALIDCVGLDPKTVDVTRLRQSVLSAAFAGKLVPQNPNDEPASELLARLCAAKVNKPMRTRAPQRTRQKAAQ